MGHSFERDDQVGRRGLGSAVDGSVGKRPAGVQQAAGATLRAARGKPPHLVRSAQAGRTAVHRPEALKRKS